jgi:hypothetical protein
MDRVVPTSAGVRDGRLAALVGDAGGLRQDWVPIGKRAVSRVGITQCGGCSASTLQRQEPVGKETQRRMVVEA